MTKIWFTDIQVRAFIIHCLELSLVEFKKSSPETSLSMVSRPGVTRPYSWYFNGRDNYPCILMGQQGYQSHWKCPDGWPLFSTFWAYKPNPFSPLGSCTAAAANALWAIPSVALVLLIRKCEDRPGRPFALWHPGCIWLIGQVWATHHGQRRLSHKKEAAAFFLSQLGKSISLAPATD